MIRNIYHISNNNEQGTGFSITDNSSIGTICKRVVCEEVLHDVDK